MPFSQRVAIISGGAHGHGRAITLALAREGASVVIADRDGQAAATLAAGITAWGGHALAVSGDLLDEAEAARLPVEATQAFGGVDLLVTADLQPAAGSVENTSLSRFQQIVTTNLIGTYLVSRFVLPEMRRRGGGAIVHLADVSGRHPRAGDAAFAAAQAGLIALSRSMALENAADGIRVNCVCSDWSSSSAVNPLQRPASSDDVANLVLFLLGPRATHLNGVVYGADIASGA